MTDKTPLAAAAADTAVVVEPTGAIDFVTSAQADALETEGRGRRATPLDLEIAGVTPR